MSDDERLLYGIHECANGHTLRIEEASAGASRAASRGDDGSGSRFEACAHIYNEAVVVGNLPDAPYRQYTLAHLSPAGKHREAAAASSAASRSA